MTVNRRFTHRILFLLVLAIVLLFAAGALLAQIETRTGDHVDASDIFPDMAFFAGGNLNVTAKSTDDIFAAGRDVTINEAQADHMIIAGGDILMTEVAFHDLIAAGGDINFVSGTVADDVVAAGGDLDLRPEFYIAGSAVLSGGDVDIEAPIGGELRAAAGRLRLNAGVDGDAHLVGETVEVGPNARIGGDLRHRAEKIEISPEAIVAGEIIKLESPTPPDMEKWGVAAAAAIAIFALAFLIGMGLLVVVIALALPSLMNSAAAMIGEKPLSTLGIGFLITAAAPVIIALLFATVFGVPLAMLIGVTYLAAAPLAIAAFAYFLGMQGRRAISSDDGNPGMGARIAWSAVAAGALVIIGLIPLIGALVWLFAYVFGMGAVMTRGGKALALHA